MSPELLKPNFIANIHIMENNKKNTITKLGDDNYYSWSYEMEMLISSKGLWNHCQTEKQQIAELIEFLEQNPTNPQADPLNKEQLLVAAQKLLAVKDTKYMSENKKCIALIGLNVDSKFIPIIRSFKYACDVWQALKHNFTSHAGGTILSLKTKFYKAEMEDSQENLNQYLDRIVLLTEKLRELGCPTQEQEICYKVLSSLPEHYNSMTMALMVVDPSKLSIAYLRSQFTLDSALHSSTQKGNALPAQPKKKFESNQKCSKCGMRNHKTEDCFTAQWRVDRYQESLKKSQDQHAKQATVMVVETAEPINKASIFYLDSGCTQHMISTSTHVTNRARTDYQIYGAFGPPSRSTECGDASFQGNIGPITLKSALIVPGLSKNLISIKAITAKGFELYFKGRCCEVYNSEDELVLLAAIEEKSGLYQIQTPKHQI
jgi:hypothetical protein